MAKQTFSVGQVLTAAQMTSLQQTAMLGGSATAKTTSYTLVAADAGTVVSVNSTSATTITVNTGLFAAGDTVTIQNWGSGAVTITAGTATVNTAGSLIVPQYDGGVLYFTSASAAIYFDWVQAGATSPLTTKGDIWGYSTSDARIPVGANNTVLTADSTEALGVKWASAGGGLTLLSTTTLSGANTTVSSISQSYKNLYILVVNMTNSTAAGQFRLAPNGNNSVNSLITYKTSTTAIANTGLNGDYARTVTNIQLSSDNTFNIVIYNYTSTANKSMTMISNVVASNEGRVEWFVGNYYPAEAISSLTFSNSGGNLSGGTVYVYGEN